MSSWIEIAPASPWLHSRERDGGLGTWAHRHLRRRPVAVLAALRVVPAGRLSSVTAAGRARLSWERFLPASAVSSVLWTTYMVSVGMLLARLTGGDATWSLVAGLVSGLTVGTVAALLTRLHRARQARRCRSSGSAVDAAVSARAGSAGCAAAAARRRPRAGCRG